MGGLISENTHALEHMWKSQELVGQASRKTLLLTEPSLSHGLFSGTLKAIFCFCFHRTLCVKHGVNFSPEEAAPLSEPKQKLLLKGTRTGLSMANMAPISFAIYPSLSLAKNHWTTFLKLAIKIHFLIWPLPSETKHQNPPIKFYFLAHMPHQDLPTNPTT